MKLNNNDLQSFEKLPQGWSVKTLGEILPLTYGKALKKETRDNSGVVPVYGSSGQIGLHSDALTRKSALIDGRKGSVGEVYRSPIPCWPIDTVYFAEERDDSDLKYFEYLLKGLKLSKLDKSTAVPGLSRDDYNAVEIAISPLDQQKRIVAEIEKQFSRLDEAATNLKCVKANLKRYKAAVLKAAVEGRLVETEADLARREGRGYETGEQLLQRILETRRGQWQGKGIYKEPATPDTADLPELPDGWTWASLGQLTSKITSGSRDWSQYYARGTGIFVLARNVRPFNPDFSVEQFVDPPSSDSSCDRSRIQDGDLLATIVGANAGQICLVAKAPRDAYVCQSVALIRPVLLGTGAHLNYWLNSAENGQRYLEQCMYGQGRPHLSFEQLMAAPIALPPLTEQQRIVAEVDRRLSLLHETATQVGVNLQRAERLRQSILSSAFAGLPS